MSGGGGMEKDRRLISEVVTGESGGRRGFKE